MIRRVPASTISRFRGGLAGTLFASFVALGLLAVAQPALAQTARTVDPFARFEADGSVVSGYESRAAAAPSTAPTRVGLAPIALPLPVDSTGSLRRFASSWALGTAGSWVGAVLGLVAGDGSNLLYAVGGSVLGSGIPAGVIQGVSVGRGVVGGVLGFVVGFGGGALSAAAFDTGLGTTILVGSAVQALIATAYAGDRR